MGAIATTTKRDFSFMGKFLFVGMIALSRRNDRQHVPADPGARAHDLDSGDRSSSRCSCCTISPGSSPAGKTNYVMRRQVCT